MAWLLVPFLLFLLKLFMPFLMMASFRFRTLEATSDGNIGRQFFLLADFCDVGERVRIHKTLFPRLRLQRPATLEKALFLNHIVIFLKYIA